MTYSLVNMPVLGFDLCRLSGGAPLAEVLLRALTLDEQELHDLAATTHVPAGPVAVPTLRGALSAMSGEAAGLSGGTVDMLERSMIGDYDDLVRLVRDDILSWTWHGTGADRWQHPDAVAGADVLAAAIAVRYGREHPGGVPELSGTPVALDALDLGPRGDDVHRLLAGVGAMSSRRREALRSASVGGPRAQWAAAVHDASWAVYLTDRLRPAAAAQLLAVRAFDAAGFTARDGAYGVWNTISGAVQATVVGDLLPEDTFALLTGGCAAALR